MKKEYILYAVIIILFFLLLNTCEKNKQQGKINDSNVTYVNDSIKYYKDSLTAYKSVANDLRILQDSTKQLKELIKNFKTVETAGNIITKVEIDTVYIPYSDTLLNFRSKTKHYTIAGQALPKKVRIDNIEVPNITSFAMGEVKKSFLKKEYRIEVRNSNPYIKTIGIDSYQHTEPIKRFGIGVSVGYSLEGAYLGIGLNYNLIRL